mmetsp:Transcript_11350/g.32097  ORF Transcript_11350/g.32097 Transcript_11350/m.32097 type:complete len:276 (+) Transcript_11350:469-1296(+)
MGGRLTLSTRFCFCSANPPTMVPTPTSSQQTFWISDDTCTASSRVGHRTRPVRDSLGRSAALDLALFLAVVSSSSASSVSSLRSSRLVSIPCSMGRAYASVLPLPVGAAPTMSLRPRIDAGSVDDWMGMGVAKPCRANPRHSVSCRQTPGADTDQLVRTASISCRVGPWASPPSPSPLLLPCASGAACCCCCCCCCSFFFSASSCRRFFLRSLASLRFRRFLRRLISASSSSTVALALASPTSSPSSSSEELPSSSSASAARRGVSFLDCLAASG